MAIPEPARQAALQAVEQYCEGQIPARARSEVRLEASIRGDAITIVERRPPWREDFGPEWTTMKIARLLYDPATATWSLWWARSNDRWEKYRPQRAAKDVMTLLATIDRDQTGVFYG